MPALGRGSSRIGPMSALGQKQTYAVHQPISALPPKADMCGAIAAVRFGPIADTFGPPTIRGLSEARAIVGSKPFDLIVGQLRGDQAHASVDVVAALSRRIELELLDEIFVALLRQHGRFDRAAGAGAMT